MLKPKLKDTSGNEIQTDDIEDYITRPKGYSKDENVRPKCVRNPRLFRKFISGKKPIHPELTDDWVLEGLRNYNIKNCFQFVSKKLNQSIFDINPRSALNYMKKHNVTMVGNKIQGTHIIGSDRCLYTEDEYHTLVDNQNRIDMNQIPSSQLKIGDIYLDKVNEEQLYLGIFTKVPFENYDNLERKHLKRVHLSVSMRSLHRLKTPIINDNNYMLNTYYSVTAHNSPPKFYKNVGTLDISEDEIINLVMVNNFTCTYMRETISVIMKRGVHPVEVKMSLNMYYRNNLSWVKSKSGEYIYSPFRRCYDRDRRDKSQSKVRCYCYLAINEDM